MLRMDCSLLSAKRSQSSTYERILLSTVIRRDKGNSIQHGAKERSMDRSLLLAIILALYSGAMGKGVQWEIISVAQVH